MFETREPFGLRFTLLKSLTYQTCFAVDLFKIVVVIIVVVVIVVVK